MQHNSEILMCLSPGGKLTGFDSRNFSPLMVNGLSKNPVQAFAISSNQSSCCIVENTKTNQQFLSFYKVDIEKNKLNLMIGHSFPIGDKPNLCPLPGNGFISFDGDTGRHSGRITIWNEANYTLQQFADFTNMQAGLGISSIFPFPNSKEKAFLCFGTVSPKTLFIGWVRPAENEKEKREIILLPLVHCNAKINSLIINEQGITIGTENGLQAFINPFKFVNSIEKLISSSTSLPMDLHLQVMDYVGDDLLLQVLASKPKV